MRRFARPSKTPLQRAAVIDVPPAMDIKQQAEPHNTNQRMVGLQYRSVFLLAADVKTQRPALPIGYEGSFFLGDLTPQWA